MGTDAGNLTIERVLRRVWDRRLVLTAGWLAGLMLALVLDSVLPKAHTATSVVSVAPLTVSPFGTSQSTQLLNMESERSAATSDGVAERAATSLGGVVSPSQLREATSISVPSDSQVMRITSQADNQADAVARANAMGAAYLDDRAAVASEAAARVASKLQASIDDRVRTRASLPPTERALLDSDLASLRERISSLSVVGLIPGRLVARATAAEATTTPSQRVLLLSGQALGLVLGLLIALLFDRFDKRVRTVSRLAEAIGVRATDARRAALTREARRIVGSRSDSGRIILVGLGSPKAPAVWDAMVRAAEELGLRSSAGVRVHGGPLPGIDGSVYAGTPGLGDANAVELTTVGGGVSAVALVRPGDGVVVVATPHVLYAEVEDLVDVMTARGAHLCAGFLTSEAKRAGRNNSLLCEPDAAAPGPAGSVSPASPAGSVSPASPAGSVSPVGVP